MHLSYQERVEIYRGICDGLSKRQIALSIGRYTSTVTREIARNSDPIGYLYPKAAHDRQLEKKRGNRTKKIDQNPKVSDARYVAILRGLNVIYPKYACVVLRRFFYLHHRYVLFRLKFRSQLICAHHRYQVVYQQYPDQRTHPVCA